MGELDNLISKFKELSEPSISATQLSQAFVYISFQLNLFSMQEIYAKQAIHARHHGPCCKCYSKSITDCCR